MPRLNRKNIHAAVAGWFVGTGVLFLMVGLSSLAGLSFPTWSYPLAALLSGSTGVTLGAILWG